MTKRIHIAIMRKSWGLTKRILAGQKIIESRWYKNKYAPWDNISPGEIIYFKDSGEPVTLEAKVKKVIQLSDLTPIKVKEILNIYGQDDGIEKKDIKNYFELFKDKKYCLLIYLENIKKVRPFHINKKGFGNMASWIMVESISKISRPF